MRSGNRGSAGPVVAASAATGGTSERLWPSTIWSLIRQGREGTAEERRDALDRLCRLYYQPVFRFFRKALRVDAGHVDDMTQNFFTRFIESDFLRNIVQEKSFRGFLKVACRRHFINWIKTVKTAGVEVPLADPDLVVWTPERVDEAIDEEMRGWFLDEALTAFKERSIRDGLNLRYQVLMARTGLDGQAATGYREISLTFGISVYDVGNHLAAARRELRNLLLELAAQRADDPAEELRELGLHDFLH